MIEYLSVLKQLRKEWTIDKHICDVFHSTDHAGKEFWCVLGYLGKIMNIDVSRIEGEDFIFDHQITNALTQKARELYGSNETLSEKYKLPHIEKINDVLGHAATIKVIDAVIVDLETEIDKELA